MRCFPIKRALVLRGGALGDFILTLPVVRALRTQFGKVEIVANRRFADLAGNPAWALDDPDLAPFFVAGAELSQRWRDYFSGPDLIVSYLYDPNAIFETNASRCGVKTFLAGPLRMERSMHAVEQLAQPLQSLGISTIELVPKIDLSAAEVTEVRAEFPLPLAAVHPGSGSPRKNWPLENWIGFIGELLGVVPIVIIGGEADYGKIHQLRAHFGSTVRYVLDWPLRKLAALLNRAIFFGHDSGVSHLAAAAGASCTVLFGPTDARVWAPRGENVLVLQSDLASLRPEQLREIVAQELMRIGIRT